MSKIAWCDITWNPGIYGCSKASPACDHCYAMSMAHRLSAMKVYPEGITRKRSDGGGVEWTGKVIVADKVQALHKLPKAKPARVFVTSMSDLFHPAVSDWFRAKVFHAMATRTHLTFQVLTKRPDVAVRWWREWYTHRRWPDHIWIGATVENQEQADKRIPDLLRIPARVRFLSCEPLLGPVSLLDAMPEDCDNGCSQGRIVDPEHPEHPNQTGDPEEHDWCPQCTDFGERRVHGLHWIICGGESGSRARPSDPRWFRALRDQCASAGVPFFFKQQGSWISEDDMELAASMAGYGWYEASPEDGGRHFHQFEGEIVNPRIDLDARYPGPRVYWAPGHDPETLDGRLHRAFPET